MKKNLPELRLGFSFFAVAAFLLSGDLYRNYLYALVFSLIHEAGHLVAMLFFGVVPERIVFEIHGIRIDKSLSALSYGKECIVALAGPLMNTIFLLIFIRDTSSLLFSVNLCLLLVNLLPVSSLDGGRLLYCLTATLKGVNAAERAVTVSGIVTAFILCVILVLLILSGNTNASVVIFAVIVIFSVASDLTVSHL